MKHKKDYIGYSIGCLTVIDEVEKKGTERCFLCKCSTCGGTHIRRLSNIKKHGTCGHKFKQLNYKRIYDTWRGMKKRCYLKSNQNYKWYGARGITVCDEWLNPDNFYNWAMANGYNDNLTIDRIDVNGNYEPNNCRWVDIKTQQNNKRNNKYITYKGETKTMSEWAKTLNINYSLLKSRLLSGWTFDMAISKPSKSIGKFTVNGEINTARYFAKKYDVPEVTVYNRLKRGLSIEEALNIHGKQQNSVGQFWKIIY